MKRRSSRSSRVGVPASASASRRCWTASAEARSSSPCSVRTTASSVRSSSMRNASARVVHGLGRGTLAPRALNCPRWPARRGRRQQDGEAGAAVGGVLGVHAAVVRLDDPGHDREPEAGAGRPALAPGLGAPEAVEERVGIVRRQPRAVVADADPDVVAERVTVTSTGVAGGVWTTALRSRLASTWRSSPGSPSTVAPRLGVELERALGRGRPRVVDRVARDLRDVDRRAAPGRAARRAARARAGPRRAGPSGPPPPRSAASRGRPPPACASRPSGTAPRSRGSTRAACAARARRRTGSGAAAPPTPASRENATSSRSSIALSASPSRPTSVRFVAGSTRRERSPPAMIPAVVPMRSSGRRPSRTSHAAATPSTSSTPTMTSASTASSRSSVASTSPSGWRRRRCRSPPRSGVASTR